MSNVLQLHPRSKVTADVTYKEIWYGEPCIETGEQIMLAHEKWNETGHEYYTVLYLGCDEVENCVEVIQKFPYTKDFEAAAKFAAEIADKSLSVFITMQPCDEEEGVEQ